MPFETGIGQLPWRVRLASWQFRYQRIQYYEYLAHALDSAVSHRTLLDVFVKDVLRYGSKHPRGILTQWWLDQYPSQGGDLSQTWHLTMPRPECAMVRMAQQSGHAALASCFKQLGLHLQVMQSVTRTFLGITATGLVAMVLAVVVCCVFPLFTLPHLLKAFVMVPPLYFGQATRAMQTWVAFLTTYGWIGLIVLVTLVGACGYSLAHVNQRWRYALDAWGVWRFYRDLHAMQFLSMTAMLLRAGMNRGIALREVLIDQYAQATPWMQGHLQRMIYQMDIGVDPMDALNTGLMGKQTWWLFIDLIQAKGLNDGLDQTCEVIRNQIATDIRQRAWTWRWGLLLAGVGCVMGMGYWHMRVIEQLRQGLLMHYATF